MTVNIDCGSAWANTLLWDREYGDVQAIPSSHRTTPSHSFKRLFPAIRLAPGSKVLDAGAGTGRHAMFLAQAGMVVHAIDTSGVACDLLTERAERSRVAVRVERGAFGISDAPSERYDLILDSYVSCHILDPDARLAYLETLLDRLHPSGRLYTSCMGAADGYYRSCPAPSGSQLRQATDPLNGITKLLRTQKEFESELTQLGGSKMLSVERFSDQVDSRSYEREVLAAVITRS